MKFLKVFYKKEKMFWNRTILMKKKIGWIGFLIATIVIAIAHYTKDGKYKGDSSVGHKVQIMVDIKDGIATTIKNRFAFKGQTMKIFEVNSDDSQKS